MSYFMANWIALASLTCGIFAMFIALYIPSRVLTNQLYADLFSEYRSTLIGSAILSVLYFYKNDCNSDIKNITEKYIEIYNQEIASKKINKIELEKTLHFKRRVIAQYYSALN